MRVIGTQYFVEHHYGIFYILTNAPLREDEHMVGGSYYLARCRARDIQSSNWQNIILPGEDVSFQDMDIFNGHLVLFLEKGGSSMICSIEMPMEAGWKKELKLDDLNPWFFPVPPNLCRIVPGSNHDFMSSMYRVVLSSPVMPDIIVDYDMSKQKLSILQQEEVVGVNDCVRGSPCFDVDAKTLPDIPTHSVHAQNIESFQSMKDLSGSFSCETREVISHDGVPVPLTILYSRETQRNNKSPGILIGYGAYGETLEKSWSADRLSLLNRGWVVAFADVRGGGNGDPSWHKAGTGFHKLNSVHDFAKCANYLVSEGYVQNNRLCAIGHSAGGLLVATTINMYPGLFHAAIMKVPFLDICNTLLDPTLPLSTLDHEEFGDPHIEDQFEFIRSYSPYDNIAPGTCPPSILVTTSMQDSRVGYWESAKWLAKVRENMCPTCSFSVILKTNMSGGHFGEGGRYSQCEESAFEYAFLMKVMGMLDSNNKAYVS